MQGNHVHTHKLANGIDLMMREIPGFGDRSEVGLFIGEKCIGSFIVDKMRSNNIMVKPTMMRTIKLSDGKAEEVVEEEEKKDSPSLTDIASEENKTP